MSAGLWTTAAVLLWREVVRFYRDRARVVGALVPPIVFWFLIGSGLGASFRGPGLPEGTGYLQFFFPGTVLLVVLFASVFSMITVIEDRREGFLQAVLVAPVPRLGVALGKILGGSLIAFLQGLAFLLLAPAAGLRPAPEAIAPLLAALWLMSFGLAGLGFWLAWRLDSTQGFHSIMNLLLIPMWLLSGALFPAEGATPWLALVMRLNPVRYGAAALQQSLLGRSERLPGMGTCLEVSAAFALLVFAASAWQVSREDRRSRGKA